LLSLVEAHIPFFMLFQSHLRVVVAKAQLAF